MKTCSPEIRGSDHKMKEKRGEGGRKFTVDSLSVNRFRSDKYVLELDLATDLVPVEPCFLVDPRMSSLPQPQDRILSWATETTDEDGTAAGAENGAKP